MNSRTAPIITVNIPILNGEKTIARAVQSILNQTFTEFELVIINDCSNDSTPQILNSFSDSRIRIIHHDQRQGISRTRNHLLRSSTGKYIAVLDGDDFSLPHRLATQMKAVHSDPSLDAVFSNFCYFTGDNPYDSVSFHRNSKEPQDMRELLLFESVLPHSTAFLSREMMGSGYNEDLACAEDYAKWLELVFSGKRFKSLSKPVSHVWSHPPNSYSRSQMQNNVREIQSKYLSKLLGRSINETESLAHWNLYETSEWSPPSMQEALEQLKSIQSWIHTLDKAEYRNLKLNRRLIHSEAQRHFYQLLSEAMKRFKIDTDEFSGHMSLKQKLKLFLKSKLSGAST